MHQLHSGAARAERRLSKGNTAREGGRLAKRTLFLTILILALAGCSGEDRIVKQLGAPAGLVLIDGGLEPSVPGAFERAGVCAIASDAERVEIQIAFVDTATAGQPDFTPSLESFTAIGLLVVDGSGDAGFLRYEGELPPRPEDRILYFFFSAFDNDGEEQRLPATSPEGAVAVGMVPFEVETPRPDWSLPFEPIECWADALRYLPEFAGAWPQPVRHFWVKAATLYNSPKRSTRPRARSCPVAPRWRPEIGAPMTITERLCREPCGWRPNMGSATGSL